MASFPPLPTQTSPAQYSQSSVNQQLCQSDIEMHEETSDNQSQQSVGLGTTSGSRKTVKLFWSSEMEWAALELYVQAVREGKQSDNGFKPETHRAIAAALREKFPSSDLDEKKGQIQVQPGLSLALNCLQAESLITDCPFPGFQKGL